MNYVYRGMYSISLGVGTWRHFGLRKASRTTTRIHMFQRSECVLKDISVGRGGAETKVLLQKKVTNVKVLKCGC
ncbi:hypothetical protein K7X08_005913 [Anisodus acutangulus]|uniref:Uncharacterized protein n=1 Tax=Anisodus acutangulus TaxID=402998 RepID=A0A9Q1LU83_9SOLA|nr:hypothetical protein K7X08_005913 [Anisodus acutangulus]